MGIGDDDAVEIGDRVNTSDAVFKTAITQLLQELRTPPETRGWLSTTSINQLANPPGV